jgi:hypothetical protein
MVKRAKVTADTFDKKASAIDKLVGNTQIQEIEAEKEQSTPPILPKQDSQRTYKPTSFYLDESQLDKLDDLSHEYKKRTGKRINRNDIVRALIDETDLEHLLRLISLEK